MSFAVRQTTINNTAFGEAVLVGNAVAVVITTPGTDSPGVTVTGVTDNASPPNVYAQLASYNVEATSSADYATVALWIAPIATAGALEVSVTLSSGDDMSYVPLEISYAGSLPGLAGSSFGGSTVSGTSLNCGNVPVIGNCLVLAACNGDGTMTVDGGYTSTGVYSSFLVEYLANTTTNPATPTATQSVSAGWWMGGFALVELVGLTVSGSSSCTVGSASPNITVTPGSAATDSGSITSSVPGDTITTSPLTWSNSSSAKAFTITPVTVGTRTITVTSADGAVVAGSPWKFIASPAPTEGTVINTLNSGSPPYLMTALTSIGTSQATAYQLTNNGMHEFTTVGSGTGAILPMASVPSLVTAYNHGSNSLTIYPPPGGTIDGGSMNASVAVAPGNGVSYWAAGPGTWYDLQTAATGDGSGTVTSVAMTLPSWLTVAGSPVTTTGTLAVTPTSAQTENQFLATPSGSPGAVGLRALVALDVPTTGLTITQSDWVIQTPADASTVNFDLSAGNCFMPDAMAGNRALTLTNAPASSPFVRPFTVILTQDGTGSRTITSWFSGFTVTWDAGTTPTLSTAPGAKDTFNFLQTGATALIGYATKSTGSGTVTNVTFTGDGTILSSTPSTAVMTTGTLTATLLTQTANTVFAGPASGSAAAPTARSLVPLDLPTTGLTISQANHAPSSPADASTINFDLSVSDLFTPAALGGNRALTLSNAPASSPFAKPFQIILLQDATGSRTITSWFSGFTVLWAGGSAPTLTTTASKRDAVAFTQIAATTLLGQVVGQNY